MLKKRTGMTTFLWIPGGQGMADDGEECAHAKQAAAIIDDDPRSVSLATASSLVGPLYSHRRTKEVYTMRRAASKPTQRRIPRPPTVWPHPPPQCLRQAA